MSEKNYSEKLIESSIKNVVITIIFMALWAILGVAMAWLPMLAYNHSLAEMFSWPKANYWQAFWFMQLSGYFVVRPRYDNK